MGLYEIFQHNSILIEGQYKFLVVSKTNVEKDAQIIFADVKTRHFIQLNAWMKDNELKEAYTFGGGKMSVSCFAKGKHIYLFGTSSDYRFTPIKLAEEIIEKREWSDVIYDLDLPSDICEGPQINLFGRSYI